MFETARTSKLLIRASVIALLAASTAACSSAPDWVDPTTWVGGSSNEPSTTPDSPAPDQTSETTSEGRTVAEASDKYPELADTPDKAPPTSSTDEQKQVANGLVADRSQAQYSAEALQAGTVESPPPPPPAPADQTPVPDSSGSVSSSDQSTASDSATTDSSASAGSSEATTPASTSVVASEPLTGRAPMPGTLPVMDASSAPVNASATAEVPPPAPTVQTAAIAPPTPSISASTRGVPAPAAPAMSQAARSLPPEDASLGFQPSHAPPLDPSVSQYVPPSVIARYQRTASLSGTPGVAAPARTASRVGTATYKRQSSGAPTAVVTFALSGTALSADARAQVHVAVQAFRAAGGRGYVRVVGHSTSLGSTSQEQLSRSFEESQACANAVAQALIKEGVPANKVLVEAVGGANGESGGRRAEIFLQG